MAYDFGSDIVVDAMRAADPSKVAEARKALQKISSEAAVSVSEANNSFAAGLNALSKAPVKADNQAEVLKKFEAVILTTFVQQMMPKNAESVFGEGLSGDMWKSQMAEKIADQLADRGGIGIAKSLLKDYQKIDGEILPLSGVRDAARAIEDARAGDGASQFLQLNELQTLLKPQVEKEREQATILSPGGLR